MKWIHILLQWFKISPFGFQSYWISSVRLNPESAPSTLFGRVCICSFQTLAILSVDKHFMVYLSTIKAANSLIMSFAPQNCLWGPAREEYLLLSSNSRAFPQFLGVQMGAIGCPVVALAGPSCFTF